MQLRTCLNVPTVDHELGPLRHGGLDELADSLLGLRGDDGTEVGAGLVSGRDTQLEDSRITHTLKTIISFTNYHKLNVKGKGT